MQQKRRAIATFLSIGTIFGIATQYPTPFHVPEWVEWILIVAYGFSVFWWYHADGNERSYKRSIWLNIIMVGLPIVGLPYYLFRSRGFRSGALAILGAAGLALLFVLLAAMSSIVVAWIRMLLE